MSWWSRTLNAFGLQRRETDRWVRAAMARAGGTTGTGSVQVTADTALRSSAAWACARLRADLISSMPVDVFRRVGGVQLEVTKPSLLVRPAPGMGIAEWLWSTQFDLDRYGNCFGIITGSRASGLPAEVELVSAGEITVLTSGRRISGYKIGNIRYEPGEIWHERQYTAAGSPLGLSPIAYAAMSIGGYLSAQQFALDWYQAGAMPSGVLRHTQKSVPQEVASAMKTRFKVAVEGRDIFVTGNDWEWTPAAGDASSAAFLDEMRYGVEDICRFLGVPGDMIDAPVHGSAVTYANVTQRNLQLLILNLAPAIVRREAALSEALPQPHFVKLNTDAILRMDPQTRSAMQIAQVDGRILAPSEAREQNNLQPFTDDQLAEFDRLWPTKQVAATPAQRALGWAPPDFGTPAQHHVIQAHAADLPALAPIESGLSSTERTTR